MAAPTSTYNSNTDLSIGHIPQVEDEVMYSELLDIHNAIESLLTSSDDSGAVFAAYIAKQRSVRTVTGDTLITEFDGLVRVDATAGDIIITARPVSGFLGYSYRVKRVDFVTANKVTLVGSGAELIDDRATGIRISTKSSYTINANTTGYDIV